MQGGSRGGLRGVFFLRDKISYSAARPWNIRAECEEGRVEEKGCGWCSDSNSINGEEKGPPKGRVDEEQGGGEGHHFERLRQGIKGRGNTPQTHVGGERCSVAKFSRDEHQ